ncbi:MAG TPA: diguanylate cyclase [Capillimicrobium sp.]|nr:diguanylate cyclase [Capillimicrobium sp.]
MTVARRGPHLLLAALAVAVLALALRNATDPGAWPAWTGYLYNAIEIGAVAACAWRALAVPVERAAWWWMTAALAAYAAGDLYWVLVFEPLPAAEIPYPSVADALYLAFFVCAYVAVVLLVRGRRGGRVTGLQWLDGAIAALATGAVATAAIDPALAGSTSGGALVVATNLAYPIGDVLLLGLVAALIGAFGRAASATWLIIALGLVVSAIADTVYLVQVADDTYAIDGLLDVTWPLALLLLAAAAWVPRAIARRREHDGLGILAAAVAGGVTVGVLVFDHFVGLPAVSVLLAAAAAVGLLARLALVSALNRRMLAASEHDARTDALTGLANRRELVRALEWSRERRWPMTLALYDLDGFKVYNDRFGHPAGDVLLCRLAERLDAAVPPPGRAYRIGGDEFCVLTPADGADAVLAAADAALRERGEGFEVRASRGVVQVPDEVRTTGHALTLADQRMYAAKRGGRASAIAQTRDVLLRAVEERNPDLSGHVDDVADLAVRVARQMMLAPDEVEHVRAAAVLHDVGKLAIPDAILDKPAPLAPDEWAFMHRHTIVGERILLAAPPLVPVAPIVRASHERWDGGGYPDGLAGEEIPLGARIVSLCDAWDAMTTDRPYRPARSAEEALEEIERCTGTQFDPSVVRAFAAVVAERRDTPLPA